MWGTPLWLAYEGQAQALALLCFWPWRATPHLIQASMATLGSYGYPEGPTVISFPFWLRKDAFSGRRGIFLSALESTPLVFLLDFLGADIY